MRLRTRMRDELKKRLEALLPEAVETVWDNASVVVAIEKLDFTTAGDFEGDWERANHIKGILRAELRSDKIDDLVVEPLIANLLTKSIVLGWPEDAAPGDTGESVRTTLADWRDVIRDQDVASGLRFAIDGVIGTYRGAATAPELLLAEAPNVGAANADAYADPESLGGGQ